MIRLVALSRAIRRAVPEAATDPFAAVTALGSASVLLVGLSVLYWVGDRRRTLSVVSYALLALAVVLAVKAGLGWPRPPADVRAVPLENDPYGFPSGHAVAGVVVYGGLAAVHDRLGDRRVLGAVVVTVALLGLSRVVLGLHYLGDVLAGIVLGVGLLAACSRSVGHRPTRGFLAATAAAVAALAVAGPGPETVLAVGAGTGGTLASSAREAVPSLGSRREGLVLVALGVPGVFAARVVADSFASPALTTLAYAGLLAGIVLLPTLVGRLPIDGTRSRAR